MHNTMHLPYDDPFHLCQLPYLPKTLQAQGFLSWLLELGEVPLYSN